jgi:type II secretory ATPase GspE/PulE/Tfp pilus assembly ATPase PilB-like protein
MKTLCTNCKEPYTPSREEVETLKREFGPMFEEHAGDLAEGGFRPLQACRVRPVQPRVQGASRCPRDDAEHGADQTMIKTRRPTEDIRAEAIGNGMLTLKQDGIIKVLMGLTDIRQVRAVAAS